MASRWVLQTVSMGIEIREGSVLVESAASPSPHHERRSLKGRIPRPEGVAFGAGADSPPSQQLGCLGSAVSSPSGVRRRVVLHNVTPDCISLCPCVGLLVYTCSYACDWGTWLPPSPRAGVLWAPGFNACALKKYCLLGLSLIVNILLPGTSAISVRRCANENHLPVSDNIKQFMNNIQFCFIVTLHVGDR